VRERTGQGPPPARPPTIRRFPGALPGEPHVELDVDEASARPAGGLARRAARAEEPDLDQRPDAERLAVGARVSHPALGEGVVRAVDGSGPQAKVTVAFFGAGDKRVIARFLRPGRT
jgi:DNA helicase-2/ATP-dependent DNA helicase PcrA